MRCGKCDAAKLCLTWFWLKCTFSLLFLLLFFINFKLLQLTSDTLLNWLNFYLFYFNVYSVRQRIANNYCHFYEKLSITSLICHNNPKILITFLSFFHFTIILFWMLSCEKSSMLWQHLFPRRFLVSLFELFSFCSFHFSLSEFCVLSLGFLWSPTTSFFKAELWMCERPAILLHT